MKSINFIIFFSAFLVIFSCKKQAKDENPLLRQKVQSEQALAQSEQELTQLNEKRRELDSTYNENREYIAELQAKKDSLYNILSRLDQTTVAINDSTLKIGIDDVTGKLNETILQKEKTKNEIEILQKKLEVSKQKTDAFKKEKAIYDEQKQALWDKGAKPEEFREVDSLINRLEDVIAAQEMKEKKMGRDIVDLQEQVESLNESQAMLSTKIRNDYAAQQVFNEYISGERKKINEKILSIDEKLNPFLQRDEQLSGKVEGLSAEIRSMQNEKEQLIGVQNEITEKQQASLEEQAVKAKKAKKAVAAVIVMVVVLLLVYFYYVGKRKKEKQL